MGNPVSNEFNKYGKQTTEAEFIAQMISAYKKSPVKASDWSNKAMNRIRTNLIADHHLGVEFPQDKRDILVQLQTKSLGKAFANLQRVPSIFKEGLEEDFIETVGLNCNNAIDQEDLARFFKQTL
jgi:hypothetical protein